VSGVWAVKTTGWYGAFVWGVTAPVTVRGEGESVTDDESVAPPFTRRRVAGRWSLVAALRWYVHVYRARALLLSARTSSVNRVGTRVLVRSGVGVHLSQTNMYNLVAFFIKRACGDPWWRCHRGVTRPRSTRPT
jgi:hypothetical protein